ncbi:MAG: chloride channel protein, partial [Bdellovibrionales bacterium]|nr:chloride channel protein [Bdellovibrionales bacterium]
KNIPAWLLPGVGGLLLGLLAVSYGAVPGLSYDRIPHVFGVGYETIERALLGELSLQLVLVLIALKIVSTCITLGSGGSGGVFAPGLFIGAMVGGAFGLVCHALFPDISAPAGAYALVGTGTFFAAMSGALVTAILMLFELTGAYQIILPLMASAVISTFLCRYLLKGESIYTLKLTRRGISLVHGKILSLLRDVTVMRAMQPSVHGIPATMSFAELEREFERNEHRNYPVLNAEGALCGFVTGSSFKTLLSGPNRPTPETPVTEIALTDPLTVSPDTPIGEALRLFSARGIHEMLVVPESEPHQLLGLIRDFDITQAYNLALIRQRGAVDPDGPSEAIRGKGTFVEARIPALSSVCGRSLKELSGVLPRESLLISIHRHERLIVPRGDTLLESGDLLRVFVKSESISQVFSALFRQGQIVPEPPLTP